MDGTGVAPLALGTSVAGARVVAATGAELVTAAAMVAGGKDGSAAGACVAGGSVAGACVGGGSVAAGSVAGGAVTGGSVVPRTASVSAGEDDSGAASPTVA